MTEAIDSLPGNERISRESPQLVALLKEVKEGLDNVKGLSILEHPVVRNLVEIRLFLEKIRPIDRKMQYQIQKLTNTTTAMKNYGLPEKETDKEKAVDLLKYRPNPDLLISKTNANSEIIKMSRKEKNGLRRETQMLRQANQSSYVRELMDDMEGKPEEEQMSREATKYIAKMEERSRQEEELFTRAPLTKAEKQKMKHLTKSRNGNLTHDGGAPDEITSFKNADCGDGKFKKRKTNQLHRLQLIYNIQLTLTTDIPWFHRLTLQHFSYLSSEAEALLTLSPSLLSGATRHRRHFVVISKKQKENALRYNKLGDSDLVISEITLGTEFDS
ncbi:hypothetical protein C2S51_027783 [Perilla frutescens var. frutescens]|nr:hypothetical protein C2S51_027783 [Perilla frutescens var. frutescens]